MDNESCNSWTESGVKSPTVSAARLGVPGKASSEYQKACGAFKGRKLPDAEVHLHKAIDLYPNYAAAYVVLGQVLQSESKNDEAQAACSKAQELDPGYVAPYLCLAEFAANEGDWKKVAETVRSRPGAGSARQSLLALLLRGRGPAPESADASRNARAVRGQAGPVA